MTPYEAAMQFLVNVGESPQSKRIQTARAIARVLEGNTDMSDIGKAIGSGSFGTAFEIGGFVFKLTSDPQEAQASANLIGADSPNVVQIFDVFKLRNVLVRNQMLNMDMPVFAVLLQRVSPGLLVKSSEYELVDIVRETKTQFEVWPNQLIESGEVEAQDRLERASRYLMDALHNTYMEELHEVGDGIGQLRSHLIYAVDFHRGNVGTDLNSGVVKIFDIGVSHSPKTRLHERENPPSWYMKTDVREIGHAVAGIAAQPLVAIPEIE